MNQPTEERLKKIEEMQENFDKRLKDVEQQQTEPIQVTVERRYPDRELLQEISRKQDEHARLLLAYSKSISTLQTDVGSLTTEMKEARADILKIRGSQADFRDKLQTIATRDDIAELKDLIQQLLPPKPSE